MEVTSFTINHDKLLRGIYVSRKDKVGEEVLTTFDIRFKRPNIEPPIETSAIHTIEHLMAVYLRGNKQWEDKIIYVGPMGCRTGMYLILKGDFQPWDIIDIMKDTFEYMSEFEGSVPATTSAECGNYLDHNLTLCKYECRKFLNEVINNIKKENMVYPV